MPRVKLSAAINERELADRKLLAMISAYLVMRDMTKLELAKRIQMPESTFRHRCRNPGDFRRAELIDIFKVLQVSEEDKKAIQW